MIQWLANIWNAVIGFFAQVGDITLHVIQKLNDFVNIIRSVSSFVVSVINWLPSWMMVFLGVQLVVMIVYIVLGREVGGD